MAEQTRLTDAELEALREKATPGPWNQRQRHNELRDEIGVRGQAIATVWVRKQIGVYSDEREIVPCDEGEANACLVGAAHPLLAEVIERRARDAAFAELIEAAAFASDVCAELYAKYQLRIGPFASQAQFANVRLRAALAAVRGGAR